jgi:apolipoprotein N-acyltransferase
MTTEVMPAEKQRQRVHHESKPAVKMIIAAARSSRLQAPALGAWGLSGLTAILLWASFTPLDWGPLAWIALVPLILLIRIPIKTRWMYTAVYGGGLTFSVLALQWMRLASAPMYVAWLLLAVCVAIYLPVFVAVSRIAVHRFGVPLTLAVPVVWVGLEYCRAHLLTGFSWYYLGHTQYRWVEMIQISDLVGAYGVSFVVAMLSACVAGLLPASLFARLKLLPAGLEQTEDGAQATTTRQITAVSVCLIVFAAVWVYGMVRRGQANFVEGPRVALVQGNFTSSMKHDPNARMTIFMKHHALTGIAVRQHPLDLIVWPETMYRSPLMSVSSDLSDEDLRRISPPGVLPEHWHTSQVPQILADLSSQSGAAMIVGLERWTAEADGFQRYNSATFARPDVGLSGRYDKIHRVIFGEYVPFKDELPWLAKLSPIPAQYGLSAGKAAAVFEYKGVRYSPIICFEDTVPHLVRRIAKSTTDPKTGKPIDCFVNLTNDGWFHGSSELDQHLITALFRCVECRTPMVRSVNTGISAVIDGDGVVVEPDDFIDADKQGRTSMRDPKTGRWHKQLNAVIVDAVPLDDRRSLYVRWGDWFAGSCALFAGCVFVGGMFPRRKRRE